MASMPASTHTAFSMAPLKSSVLRASSSKFTPEYSNESGRVGQEKRDVATPPVKTRGPRKSKGTLRTRRAHTLLVDVHLAGVDLHDASAGVFRGCGQLDLSVQAARAQQSRIQRVGTVRRSNDLCYAAASVAVAVATSSTTATVVSARHRAASASKWKSNAWTAQAEAAAP